MKTIALKIKMLIVFFILKVMGGNIETVNEEVKKLTAWGNEKNEGNLLLGSFAGIDIRLIKEGRAWWIHITDHADLLFKDRLTNGFYAFNKKTVGRLKEKFIDWAGTEFKEDLDKVCKIIEQFDYLSQVPSFGIFDRFNERKKPAAFHPLENLKEFINIKGEVGQKLYGQYLVDLTLEINSKFATGIMGKLICETVKMSKLELTTPRVHFNCNVGDGVTEYLKEIMAD